MRASPSSTPTIRCASASRLDDLVRALRFILQTPSFTGDTLIVDSGEHLTGRPRDVAFDRKGKA